MAFADDKKIVVTKRENFNGGDALLDDILSSAAVTDVRFPAASGYPSKHTSFDLVGTIVPSTEDELKALPIGSTYLRLILQNGVVTGSELYLMTAAETWTAISGASAANITVATDSRIKDVIDADYLATIIDANYLASLITVGAGLKVTVSAGKVLVELDDAGGGE